MTTMRAKFIVSSVQKFGETQETVGFRAVGPKGPYPADGSDEDNTFAKFTPNAECSITILNPALLGKFALGDTFYADFHRVPK